MKTSAFFMFFSYLWPKEDFMINTNIHLAILGYGKECTKKNAAIATSIGKLAAKNGISLVAGNITSTFHYAFQAANDYKVNTICVIEKHKKVEPKHFANEVYRTRDTYQKHKQISQIGDAAVLIGGGAGSSLLLKYFLKNKKTVIAIKGSGGLADSELPKEVLQAANAREAFKMLNEEKKVCSFNTEIGNIELSYDHFALRKATVIDDNRSESCDSIYDFAHQIQQYVNSDLEEFEGKVHLKGTDFQKKVWNAILDIPYGKTISYGELAAQLGDEKLSGAVGQVVGQNPLWIITPCHRVIGKTGALSTYAGGLEMKMRLLDLENRQTELNIFN